MPDELVKVETVGVPAASGLARLPSLVERAGVAGRFACGGFAVSSLVFGFQSA